MTGDELEAEAEAIVSLYNEEKPDYSNELEWVGMTLEHDTEEDQFVMEAENYIDPDGLDALRDAGWQIQYIEAHQLDDDVLVSITLPVTGCESASVLR